MPVKVKITLLRRLCFVFSLGNDIAVQKWQTTLAAYIQSSFWMDISWHSYVAFITHLSKRQTEHAFVRWSVFFLDVKMCKPRSVNCLCRWAFYDNFHRHHTNALSSFRGAYCFLTGRMFTSCTVHSQSDGCMPVLITVISHLSRRTDASLGCISSSLQIDMHALVAAVNRPSKNT